MKNDDSVKEITIAAIRRKTIDIDSWSRTKFIDSFPSDLEPLDKELPVVYFKIDTQYWTHITTQRIIGQLESAEQDVSFEELDDVIWGFYNDTKNDKTIFRVTDVYGEQKDFYMETGFPAMAFVYGIRTINRLIKSGTAE